MSYAAICPPATTSSSHRCCPSGSSLYLLLHGWATVAILGIKMHVLVSLECFVPHSPFFFFLVITFALQVVVIVTDTGTAEDSQPKLCVLLQLVLAFCPSNPTDKQIPRL